MRRKVGLALGMATVAVLTMGSASSCEGGDSRIEDLETVCDDHDGVSALDDGVVVCGDGTVRQVEADSEG